MVNNITSFTGKGLRDWFLQRVSAVLIAAYSIFMTTYFIMHPDVSFSNWQALFDSPWVQISTVIVLLSVIAHAWIGIWTVLTDYVKCTVIRVTLMILMNLLFLAMLVWGVMIFLR